MPRNMSFMLTTEQVRNKTKYVTRRDGWDHVKVGEIIQAVEKCQGIPKGGHVVKLHLIRVKSKRREKIDRMIMFPGYGYEECAREGFPGWTPEEFVAMYCKHNKKKRWDTTNRIEFEYLD